MKVIIAGTRQIKMQFPEKSRKIVQANRDKLSLVSGAMRDSGWAGDCTHVVSGMDLGVDLIGLLWGLYNGKIILPYPADWDRLGKRAGPMRNGHMVEVADALVLIWSGDSRGSADVKRKAERKGIPIFERLVGKDAGSKKVWTF